MRIGILTSGGDAPGMNAVLLGAALAAHAGGHELVGIEFGFVGLFERRLRSLGPAVLRSSLAAGGTVLGTSRPARMRSADGVRECASAASALGLDNLVIVGGAGSLAAAATLDTEGVRVIGIPCTIDGDIPYPSVTIGMDSAVNYAIRAIDDLRVTANALPGRAFVVETLGGDTGHVARAVADAACCPIVLTPEEPWSAEDVAHRMRTELDDGYTIVIASEAVGHAADLARELEPHLGARIRHTTLGHSMRGASPSARDRHLGRSAGNEAIRHAEIGTPSSVLNIAADSAITPRAMDALRS